MAPLLSFLHGTFTSRSGNSKAASPLPRRAATSAPLPFLHGRHPSSKQAAGRCLSPAPSSSTIAPPPSQLQLHQGELLLLHPLARPFPLQSSSIPIFPPHAAPPFHHGRPLLHRRRRPSSKQAAVARASSLCFSTKRNEQAATPTSASPLLQATSPLSAHQVFDKFPHLEQQPIPGYPSISLVPGKVKCSDEAAAAKHVPLETQDTHREVRDCADEDDYGSTRERSVLLQVLEDETDDDHSYDGRR
ncbi:hypothetical protein U9M48_013318 [Paspalum notatum var. saurae]|uniref:Uncharacterized protein n=1 Tax=Paspalum notatum var. saurae TaxID=547442 RepID=A0AAQ3SZQ9_PASNO